MNHQSEDWQCILRLRNLLRVMILESRKKIENSPANQQLRRHVFGYECINN